jgi:hypothetical protein
MLYARCRAYIEGEALRMGWTGQCRRLGSARNSYWKHVEVTGVLVESIGLFPRAKWSAVI